MTQVESAQKGIITREMQMVSDEEHIDVQKLRDGIAAGKIVIPANNTRELIAPRGVGAGLRTKVNANIGTSCDFPDVEDELLKLHAAVDAGADAMMDLSTGGDLNAIRARIVSECPVCLGTVPIYDAAVTVAAEKGSITLITEDDLLGTLEYHAKQGVDFMTIHSGITRESIARLRAQGRIMDVVSRGGAFLVTWILANEKENPFYEQYDDILDIARKYDITLSLGDGMRPGCLADATDRAQVQELIILGELVKRARAAGVQVMVEGPGHVPLNQIAANMLLEKQLCEDAPFYVLGPLVTDIAPGYDHITAAIGGAIAASSGADFICYVTPTEHLSLPAVADVREGVMAARIAGHAADIVKGIPGAIEWDIKMAHARKARNWEEQMKLAIDPEKATRLRSQRASNDSEVCSMCSGFCAMKVVEEYLGKTGGCD